jgi:hypothetical protein
MAAAAQRQILSGHITAGKPVFPRTGGGAGDGASDMASMATDVHDGEVSIGRILGRGFSAIAGNPGLLGLALVFGALPNLIILAGWAQLLSRSSTLLAIAAALGFTALNMASAAMVQGTVALPVVADAEGRSTDIADTLPPALVRLLPLVLLGSIVGLGFTFGLVLLIVPGVILYVMWWVAAPALVVERLGVVEALRRSAELSSGARWKIFGIELLLGVVSWMITTILDLAGVSWTGMLGGGISV